MVGSGWVRVITTVVVDEVEAVSDLLWSAGCAGIEEQEAEDAGVRLLAGFAAAADARSAVDLLAARGIVAQVVEVDAARIDDDLDGWREHARIEQARTFWIVPTWLPSPSDVDPDDVLVLDPGRTFGSGSHPTTRLVLALLDGGVAGSRVLDVGCGSGILAIGAARRGASFVVAIDIDPAAPEITTANATRNGVGNTIVASNRPLAEVAATIEPFDLVLANLLAPTVHELAPDLVAATAPTGTLIVSGLLADRWEQATEALAPLAPTEVHEADGWVAVVLRRPSG